MGGFKPTLRYLQRTAPKWDWVETRLSDSGALAGLKALGMAIDSAPMALGQRSLGKRIAAPGYIVVDKWNSRLFYACQHPALDDIIRGGLMWKWNDGDQPDFLRVLDDCLDRHGAAGKVTRRHLSGLDEKRRHEAELAEFEERNGALDPLERLRMRYS